MKILRLKPTNYSDVAYIDGVYRCDPAMERELHKLCREYYDKNFRRPEADDEGRKDIFQSSILALWENIRDRKLYAENGELKGRNGSVFTSTLTTYFMGIVNNKFLEWLRKKSIRLQLGTKGTDVTPGYSDDEADGGFMYDDEDERKLNIVANRMSRMAKQCNKILTLFYCEEKDYDEIMVLIPTFQSKDALKTAKYKCLKRLRESVTGTYC